MMKRRTHIRTSYLLPTAQTHFSASNALSKCPHSRSPPVLTFEKDIARRPFKTPATLINSASCSKFTAALTKFVNVFCIRSASAEDDISASMGIMYSLLNVDEKFTAVCADENVKSWLEILIKLDKDVYFVTGFTTLQDAQVNTSEQRSAQGGGALQAPMTAAATQGGSTVLLPAVGDALDVKVAGECAKTTSTKATFEALGQRVVAVEYQQLKFRLLKKKSVETASLGTARWQALGGDRGAAGDMIEAGLGALGEDEAERLRKETEIWESGDQLFVVVQTQSDSIIA
jgi:hypothetical protein